ncbi:MAG: hypothetical protein K8S25_16450 [Alphaproteobacteria bacterium]|nr:hypothetical protein [Alphaproteobacteria bacterium]
MKPRTQSEMRLLVSLALAVALVMGARAAIARDLPPIKTVGVIADVGNKISWKHIGFMVFSNEQSELEFADWQVDAALTAELEAALKGRYELGAVTFTQGTIKPDVEKFFWHLPTPKENVRDHARPADGQPLDAYLVAWPWRSEIYGTNQAVSGLGIVTRGGVAFLHAAIALTLVDGRTFEDIDSCYLRTPDVDLNHMLLRRDLNAESYEAMTVEQKQAFEQGLKDFVREGLAYCLKDLKLTP